MPLQGCWVINPADVGKVSRAGFDPCKLWYVTVSTIIFSFHMPFEGLSGGKDLLHRWDQSREAPSLRVEQLCLPLSTFSGSEASLLWLIFVSSRLISCFVHSTNIYQAVLCPTLGFPGWGRHSF